MSDKKAPIRKCIGCGESFFKKELIRIVRTPTGEIVLDLKGKASGRGAYVCCMECFDKAIKGKKLERALSKNIDKETVKILSDKLLEITKNKEMSIDKG
ncbi:YlxR family protein [Candidatus Oleimmundimicrobium sp.]|uniref:RNase P modulator RnpM n=1 Tax=Candidatus Oleimmundimicrobium sp. TaxID=3060597 RepID=UPI00271C2D10|nr:YlxR family protein [Candidatus Oleimmundimicrobium sp.]MDO8885450.1 YlxR family protein [Candidatus Oleimmundimicrobium sp.]